MLQAIIAVTQKNYEMGKVTYSRVGDAAPKFTEQGLADFHHSDKLMTKKTISGIGSITKQFTAATLLKLWDEEITRNEAITDHIKKFPNGIDTTFSSFLPILKAKFPKCETVFGQFELNENFSKITLRNLLNHNHGLGARDNKKTCAAYA